MKCILNYLINPLVSEYFKKEGFEIIYTDYIRVTDDFIGCHPDIQCAVIGDTFITSKKHYNHYKKYISDILISEKELEPPYPSDVLFNFFEIGNRVFGNEKYLDKRIMELIEKNKLEFNYVNQGYSNCSSLMVAKKAVITSDKGMEKAFLRCGFDVLMIDNSKIKLKGHKNGFIGGAACNFNNKIVFFGNIKKHPDFDKMDAFLKKYDVSYIDFPFELEDFGGALFF